MTAVTYQEVAAAISRLTTKGQKVTDSAVREELGNRGSFATINKHKRQFFSQLRENSRAMFGPDIPETLMPILHSFWNEAILHAGEHNHAELERLRASTEAAQEAMRQAQLSASQHQRAEAEALQSQLNAEADCERLRRELAAVRSELLGERESAAERENAHRAEIERRELALQKAISDGQLELQKQGMDYEVRLSEMSAQLNAARDNLKYERERSDAESSRLMQLVYDAREEARQNEAKIRELQEYITQAKKKADAEIHIANEKATIMAIKADRLQAQLERKDSEL